MATREEEIKRSQVFAVWCQKSCNFVLRERSLNCEQENEVFFSVNLEDLLGLRVLEKPAQGRPQVCQAEICTFMLSKKKVKKIKTKLIQFSEGGSYDENNETAQNWRKAIQLQCQKNDHKMFVRPDSGEYCGLCLINNNSYLCVCVCVCVCVCTYVYHHYHVDM